MRRRTFIISTSIAVAGLLTFGCLTWFREIVIDSSGERAVLKRNWGGMTLVVDHGPDGQSDYRAKYDGWSLPSPDDPPRESWHATQCDGSFDLHLVFDLSGQLERVEQDLDSDGTLETVFEGRQAALRLGELRGTRPCF